MNKKDKIVFLLIDLYSKGIAKKLSNNIKDHVSNNSLVINNNFEDIKILVRISDITKVSTKDIQQSLTDIPYSKTKNAEIYIQSLVFQRLSTLIVEKSLT